MTQYDTSGVTATARGALAMYPRGVLGTRTLDTRNAINTGNTKDYENKRNTGNTEDTLTRTTLQRANFSCSRVSSKTGCRIPMECKACAPEVLPWFLSVRGR
jgi:hypothetical protein